MVLSEWIFAISQLSRIRPFLTILANGYRKVQLIQTFQTVLAIFLSRWCVFFPHFAEFYRDSRATLEDEYPTS